MGARWQDQITLALVTRDRPAILARNALAGLRSAAAREFPVVVVDQSTSGATAALVSTIEGVTFLTSAPGLSVGRNVAIAATATPFVAFTDDDVVIPDGWLPSVATALGEGAEEVGALMGRASSSRGHLLPGAEAGSYRWPCDPFLLGSGFNMSLRTAAVRILGGFDEALGAGARYGAAEDTDILYRLLRAGWSVWCRDDIPVVHEDWRSKREELSLHYRYGVGAGAMVAKHRGRGDSDASMLGRQRAFRQIRSAARSAASGHLRTAVVQAGFVAGMATGAIRRWRER